MEDIIKRLSRYSPQCIADRLDPDFAEANVDAIEMLKAIDAMNKLTGATQIVPTATGDWVAVSHYVAQCTNCRAYWIPRGDENMYNYCPHCGARMDGAK